MDNNRLAHTKWNGKYHIVFTPKYYRQIIYKQIIGSIIHTLCARKGVKSVLRIYGEKSREDIGHVFHLNCHLEEADRCNDEQCAFFRDHIVSI